MLEWISAHVSFKSGAVFTALILILLLERLFPAVQLRNNLARVAKNFSLAALNFIASPFIVIPVTLASAQWAVAWRPEWANGLIIDLLVLDCWIYFWHRANHVIPFLWRFHEVHHLDENLDASSALRFHFGEVVLSALVRAAIIFALAIPVANVMVFETLVVVAALFHHSNLRLPAWAEKRISFIVVTPSIHFIHHHALRSDTDSNYATLLSLWDRLFGSRSLTMRQLDMKMGVEGKSERSFFGLILKPFIRA